MGFSMCVCVDFFRQRVRICRVNSLECRCAQSSFAPASKRVQTDLINEIWEIKCSFQSRILNLRCQSHLGMRTKYTHLTRRPRVRNQPPCLHRPRTRGSRLHTSDQVLTPFRFCPHSITAPPLPPPPLAHSGSGVTAASSPPPV